MRTKILLAAALCVAAVALVGCGSDSSTGTVPTNTVTLKLVVNSSTDLSDGETLTKGTPWNEGTPDSLTITWGKFLVRSLQFKTVTDYTVDTDISAADETRDQSDPNIPYQGPYVLPVTGSQTANVGSQTVEVGDYNAISLILHKGKSADDLGSNTDMIGRSVRVTGNAWYGDVNKPFDFVLDLRTEILIRGDFTVPATGTPEYVLEFDVGKWFRSGDEWLKPNESENLPLIYRNIQREIKGGRDYNGDGSVGD